MHEIIVMNFIFFLSSLLLCQCHGVPFPAVKKHQARVGTVNHIVFRKLAWSLLTHERIQSPWQMLINISNFPSIRYKSKFYMKKRNVLRYILRFASCLFKAHLTSLIMVLHVCKPALQHFKLSVHQPYFT